MKFTAILILPLILFIGVTYCWEIEYVPTELSYNGNYHLYSFCIPVDVVPDPIENVYVELFFEYSSSRDTEISIDWGNDEPGVSFHGSNVDSLILFNYGPTEANWTPIWKTLRKGATFNGLIASFTKIEKVILNVDSNNLLSVPEFVSKCDKECNGVADKCGVCNGDGSSCTYPLCNGFPVSEDEASECLVSLNYFGEGQVAPIIVAFSIFPVVLIPLCFCLLLQRQKNKINEEREIQDLQDSEEFNYVPSDKHEPIQSLYPQFSEGGYTIVSQNGVQAIYYASS